MLVTTSRHSWMAMIAIAVLAACGGSGASALRATSWELQSLNGNGLLPGTTITIKFSSDQVTGSAGCNQYAGSFLTGDTTLSIDDVFSTEMGCMEPEGILEQEQVYLAALAAAAKYQTSADILIIFDQAGTQILEFGTLIANSASQ